MITEERLRELIEQGATIYSTHWKEEIDLSKYYCEIFEMEWDGKTIKRLVVHEDEEHAPSYMLDNLTEDIEAAKWEEEFGCIKRTEKLYLPSFKEVYEDLEGRTGEFIIADPSRFTFVIKKSFVDQILLRTEFDNYNWNFNKENYILACRKAKELFLGDENV